MSRAAICAALVTVAVAAPAARAQHDAHAGHTAAADSARPRASAGWGVQATLLATRVSPMLGGAPLTEGYLSQPHLMGHAATRGGHLVVTATLNLEGLTLQRGELSPGMSGEGYVDRRHPHTYVHDLVASVRWPVPRGAVSLSAGRGFTPFGTEDPMDRPFAKFPVNHHQAQVMERLLAVGAVRWGATLVEVGTFNGDEPAGPGRAPRLARFGDSWAARATVFPASGLELSASHARVASPEVPAGWYFDQRKWSASARWERAGPRGVSYALAEWATTDEVVGARHPFQLSSVLAEASVTRRWLGVAARVERTTRPEEERLVDPFRTLRPPHDFGVLGITRWDVATVALRFPAVTRALARHWSPGASRSGLGLEPFAEVARLRATRTIASTVFDPGRFYGSDRMWMLTLGTRFHAGTGHPRVGQYGAAARAGAGDGHAAGPGHALPDVRGASRPAPIPVAPPAP